jgi:hypothetical protein
LGTLKAKRGKASGIFRLLAGEFSEERVNVIQPFGSRTEMRDEFFGIPHY